MESSSSVIVDISKKQIIQLAMEPCLFLSTFTVVSLPLIHGGYVPRPPSGYLKPQIQSL